MENETLKLTVYFGGKNFSDLSEEKLKSTLEAVGVLLQKELLSTTLYPISVELKTEMKKEKTKIEGDVNVGDVVSYNGSLYRVAEIGLNNDKVKLKQVSEGYNEVSTTKAELLGTTTRINV